MLSSIVSTTRRRGGVLGVLASIALVAPSLAEPVFEIHGSNTIGAELMPALIQAYAESERLTLYRFPGQDSEHETLRAAHNAEPVFTIQLAREGSGTAFEALQGGIAEIGMASRRIKDAEAKSLGEATLIDMTAPGAEHVIALDGLALIVSPASPLASIDLQTAARIFSGEISDWSELGLSPAPITVHARDDVSGTFDTFKTLVLKRFEKALTPGAARYASNQKLAETVAADPHAIGFAPLAFAPLAKTLAIQLDCGLIVSPDKFTVKAEEYPLGRRLYLYTLGQPRGLQAARLMLYAASDQAQSVVDAVGFVDQSIQQQSVTAYSDHLIGAMAAAQEPAERSAVGRFAQLVEGGARLSTTFRFASGGELLDAKGVADAGRLARWLERPENTHAEIMLVGFADSRGGYDANLPLTVTRADAARRAVLTQVSRSFDPRRVTSHAFSTIAPVACNTSDAGRAANRRVEVWVKRRMVEDPAVGTVQAQ